MDVIKICIIFVPDSETNYMVDVAQSVRVTDCGSEGRGFESHLPPKHLKRKDVDFDIFFCFGADVAQTCLQTHLPQNNIVDSSTLALSVCWRPRGKRKGKAERSGSQSHSSHCTVYPSEK